VEYAQREPRLQGWVGTTMLRSGIVAIANSAASYYGAEVLGLLRDILVQQLNSQPGPSQVADSGPQTLNSPHKHCPLSQRLFETGTTALSTRSCSCVQHMDVAVQRDLAKPLSG